MHKIQRSAMVPYSADEMYELVTDVNSYADFLPWCGETKILSTSDNVVVAEIKIAFKGLRKQFTTKNINTPSQGIEMSLVDGPFSHLQGSWAFRPISDSVSVDRPMSASNISLSMEFSFSGVWLDRLIAPIFTQIANTMVEAFVERAESQYGKRELF